MVRRLPRAVLSGLLLSGLIACSSKPEPERGRRRLLAVAQLALRQGLCADLAAAPLPQHRLDAGEVAACATDLHRAVELVGVVLQLESEELVGDLPLQRGQLL